MRLVEQMLPHRMSEMTLRYDPMWNRVSAGRLWAQLSAAQNEEHEHIVHSKDQIGCLGAFWKYEGGVANVACIDREVFPGLTRIE